MALLSTPVRFILRRPSPSPRVCSSLKEIFFFFGRNNRKLEFLILSPDSQYLQTDALRLFELAHVRYINILTWLRGFQYKLLYFVLFPLYPSLFWELRQKKLKNLQF